MNETLQNPARWRRGDEAERIGAFKGALGLSDEDAAPVHIDVGRRIMRSKFEAASRAGSSESTRALQKLIYVSDILFGERKVLCASCDCHLNLRSPAPASWLCTGACCRMAY